MKTLCWMISAVDFTNKKKFIQKAHLILSALFFWSCAQKPIPIELQGKTMGTTYVVKYMAVEGKTVPSSGKLQLEIDEYLRDLNQEMSTYIENSLINQFGLQRKNRQFPVSERFLHLLFKAKILNEKSAGLYDVTVTPLVELWGFGAIGRRTTPPEAEEIAERLKYVGMEKIAMDFVNKTIKKTTDGVRLDFSSIAKGQGVDGVAAIFEKYGILNYMVEIGGELRVRGSKNDGPWVIAIERPTMDDRGIQRLFELKLLKEKTDKRLAMATSGNYRNFFKHGEALFSHTINPKTGRPGASRILSATVINLNGDCEMADGWATALMVMGEKAAIKAAEDNSLAVYFVIAKSQQVGVKEKATTTEQIFDIYESPAFKDLGL